MDSLTKDELVILKKVWEYGNKYSVEELSFMREESLKENVIDEITGTLKAFWNVAISIAKEKTAQSGNSKAVLSENA
ncbi:hypothetical protein [Aminipila sp.]|uniref:hypothetical protein n=1 Tax=Aminipila sp. TaxID=2060095 RepID=UPI00289B7CE0|nr:hypothetical protein [Aminipila sp.]